MLPVAVFVCLGWILSVCLHEFGHALVAYWGGDTSVKDKGYLTLNPLKYTNFNLSLLLPLLFLLMGGIALPGAAVYIDRGRLRNRWWQSAVSAAGPIASIIVTLLLTIPFQLSLALRHTQYWWICPALACLIFLQVYVTIINSLPIPSLDGYGVIEPWLPRGLQTQLAKYSSSGLIFLFLLLMFVRPINLLMGDSATTIAQFLGVPSIAIAAGFGLFKKSSSILLVTVIGIVFLIQKITKKLSNVWYKRGMAFGRAGQYEKALAAYNWAIRVAPKFEQAWHYKGLALFKLRQFSESISSYDRMLQLNSNYYQTWYNRGLALHYSKQYEEAIASFDRAIQIQPDLALAWHYRALSLYGLLRYEEAISNYDKAIEIQPNLAQAWTHRGCTLKRIPRYEEAIVSFERAIQIETNDADAWSDRGDVLTTLKRYEEAVSSCDRAIEIKPDYNLAWLNRGIALEKMQRDREAVNSYERVVSLKLDNSSHTWGIRGYALVKLKRYEEALAACDRAIQIDHNYSGAWYIWYVKACCYAQQGKVCLAIEQLRKAVKFEPRLPIGNAQTDFSFNVIRDNEMFKQFMEVEWRQNLTS